MTRSIRRLAVPALAGVLALAASTAAAGPQGDPTAVVLESGAVQGTVTVGAAPDAVLARVGDPAWVARTGGGSTDVAVAETVGACSVLDYVSHHPIATATYRVRQCPTESGFAADLLQSESFSKYVQRWDVEATPGGSRITYQLHVETTLPVPQWMVRKSTRSSVQKLMERIAEQL